MKVKKSSSPKHPFFYGYIIVIASFFIFLVAFAAQSVYSIFFNPVLIEFGWSRTVTSGAFSLAMLISGLSAALMGRFNDRFGPRLMITICGLFIGTGYLLMSLIKAEWQLYLFYGLIVGIGVGGVFAILPPILARWFIKRRGMMTGVALAGTGTGALIVPPLASWMIYSHDWRTSYMVLGVVFLIIVLIASQFIKHDPAKMNLHPYGYKVEEQEKPQSATEGFSLSDSLKTRQFWQLIAMSICFGFTMFSVIVHIIVHATDIGIPAISAATIMIAIGASDVIGRSTMGSAADKIGNKRAFIIGFTLISAALFWLLIARELWMLYLFAVVFGLAYSTLGTVISPLAADTFGLRSHSSIYGLVVLGFQIGGTIGPLLVGYLFDVQGNYNTAFSVCAGVGIVGILLSVFLKPNGSRIKIAASPARL